MKNVSQASLLALSTAFFVSGQISTITDTRSCSLQLLTSHELLQKVQRKQPLRSLARTEDFADLLTQVEATPNLRPRTDDAIVLGDPGKGVLIVELQNSFRPDDKLYSYYMETSQATIILHLSINTKGRTEMRLWSGGDQEILITEEKTVFQVLSPALESAVSNLLLTSGRDRFLSISESIQCLGNALGISIDSSSLTNLIASVTCSARDTWSLYKTAAHCVSAFTSVGGANVVSGAFCTVGLGVDLGCNLLNCTSTPTPPPTTTNCTATIAPNSSTPGTWTNTCVSPRRSGTYAKFYTFTLQARSDVRIDLTSSGIDNYLYLLAGNSPNGSVIREDDDSLGNAQATISATLNAGTYTIEATTYRSGITGNFGIAFTANSTSAPVPPTTPPPTTTSCSATISVNNGTSGQWVSSCPSTHRSGRYAKYYTFSLTSRAAVQIDLTSTSIDTYLFLLSGSSQSGSVLAEDDDGGTGANSRIARVLDPGTYTLECTTYSSNTTGSFTVTVTR